MKTLGPCLCHLLDLFLQVATLSYNQLAKIGSYAESQINIWQQGMEFPRLA